MVRVGPDFVRAGNACGRCLDREVRVSQGHAKRHEVSGPRRSLSAHSMHLSCLQAVAGGRRSPILGCASARTDCLHTVQGQRSYSTRMYTGYIHHLQQTPSVHIQQTAGLQTPVAFKVGSGRQEAGAAGHYPAERVGTMCVEARALPHRARGHNVRGRQDPIAVADS